MFGILHQFLVENGRVFLQGTGLLHYSRIPAVYDASDQMFFPPKQLLLLESDPPPDPALTREMVRFIARNQDITEENAFELYEAFCLKGKAELDNQGALSWPLLGLIRKNEAGELTFEAEETGQKYFEPIAATRVIRQNVSHQLLVGTTETTTNAMREHFDIHETNSPVVEGKWWIPALIIGLASLVLIYLRKSGML